MRWRCCRTVPQHMMLTRMQGSRRCGVRNCLLPCSRSSLAVADLLGTTALHQLRADLGLVAGS